MTAEKIITISQITADKFNHSLRMDREDIIQELSLLLWQITETQAETLSQSDNPDGYLYTTAANWCKRQITREHESGEWITDSSDNLEDLQASGAVPETKTLRGGRTIVVDEYISAKIAKQREYNRQYYQTHRDKMLERSNARNHRVRGGMTYDSDTR